MRALTALLLFALVFSPNPLGASGATLGGAVVDRLGAPVVGASVIIVPDERSRPVALAITGAKGKWSRDGVLAGAYRLIASKLGYAPTIQADVQVEDGSQRLVELTLTPVEKASDAGRRNLTWLVRGLSGDVLRLAEDGDGEEVLQRPGNLWGLPLSGRVALTTVAGDGLGGSDTVDGRITDLALSGDASERVSWHLVGRKGEQEVVSDGVEDALESDRVRYGVALAQPAGGLWRFEGALARTSRQVEDPQGRRVSGHSQLVSYSLGWSRSNERGDLSDVQLAYTAAETGRQDQADTHAMLVTRGSYGRSLGGNHRLNTQVELSTQSYTRPSGLVFAQGLDGTSSVMADSSLWAPSDWALRAEGEHLWEGSSRLTLVPGFELYRSAGGSLPAYLQPRLAMQLKLDTRTALGTEISYNLGETELESGDDPRIGYGLRLERTLGDAGLLSLSARLNARRGMSDGELSGSDFNTPDFIIVSGEQSSSRELAVGLEGNVGNLLRGRLHAVVGEADGRLMLLPLGERALGGELRELSTEPVQYLVTTLGTTLHATDTDLDLSYRWADGIVAAADQQGDTGYARLDLRLRQALPWSTPLASRVDFLLNVRSYLARPVLLATTDAGDWTDLDPAQHTVTGGVAILF